MSGYASSAACGSPSRRSTAWWPGSARRWPSRTSGPSRASTCTSRSPSSGTARRSSCSRSSVPYGTLRPGPSRPGSPCAATARRAAWACSPATTKMVTPRRSRPICSSGSRRSASTSPSGAGGCRPCPSCASASGRGCGRRSRRWSRSRRPTLLLSCHDYAPTGRVTKSSNPWKWEGDKSGPRAGSRHRARPDRAPVRQGLGDAHERPRPGRDRGGLDRLALARPRAWNRRAAAWPHRRGLRPGVVGQDDARLPRDPPGPAPRRGLRPHRQTTLVYHVIAEAQRRGGICAFIDAEHSMDPAYAKRIGVNIDDLLVSQPDTGEQALEICELLVRSGALAVVAIDSVAALTPKAEIEGEMGDSHVGLQARLMSQALRKLAGTLNQTDTICLFTNQLREKIGVMFGSPETTPGGRALRFYASIRLDIRRIETLKEGVEAIGNRVRVKVVKNKVAPPFKQAEFDIIYGDGISWEGTVLDAAVERKIVQKSGAYFSFDDERLGQGRHNATAFLREHPDVCQKVLAGIQEQVGPEQIVSARLDSPLPVVADAPLEPAEESEENAKPANGKVPEGVA